MNDLADRLRLARTEGVGPATYRRLLDRCGDPASAIAALPALARAGGRAAPPRIPSRAEAEDELAALGRLGGRLVVLDGPFYPPLLAALELAPPVLSVLGRVEVLAARGVAIVGSRNASANGARLAEILADGLARAGLAVISGMARGIDAAAHLAALGAGTTIAAVAGGLDVPYPPEHAGLQRRIAEIGAVVTEAPLGTAPQARHFPRRNRIIAGLALGVVVVEAAPRSGSLITARMAAEADRDVFAVPGSPLDPRCRGSNGLLREGAHITETADDVLAQLPAEGAGPRGRQAALPGLSAPPAAFDPAPAGPPFGPDSGGDSARRRIADLLGPAPVSVDDLVRRCQLPAAATMAALLELELAGRVEMLPGNRVALTAA